MNRYAVVLLLLAAGFSMMGGMQLYRSKLARAEASAAFESSSAGAQNQTPSRDLAFDGKRAMGYIESVCKLGPRMSGTEAMKKQQELIKKHFEALGGKVTFQKFSARQHTQPQPTEMTNIIVSWFPEKPRRVILCSHYDTRPIADQEEDPRKWTQPFVSANDGGSGVAVLMELANHMKDLKTAVGVDFVLFDGEEYIFDSKKDRYFIGSEHFADEVTRQRGPNRYVAAVLMDMIGGKNPQFPAEQHSLAQAGPLLEELWRIAEELKCKSFLNRVGPAVLDDHLALNRAGIPAVDIIDFDYPHWHRLSDVPANCSEDGLRQVSRVLWTWMQRAK